MIYPALLGSFKFMPNSSVGPSECETKFSSKEIWYGLRENAWFPWQPLIRFSRWGGGVGSQIQSYLGFYLSQNTKIGVKLKIRHMSFFLWSDMNINENLQK